MALNENLRLAKLNVFLQINRVTVVVQIIKIAVYCKRMHIYYNQAPLFEAFLSAKLSNNLYRKVLSAP